MKKPIQIHIPDPCKQDWDEMTPAAGGRHCDHCRETVTDFTTWSDAALYNFFSKNDKPICGRYLSTQLDRPIHIPPQPYSRLYRIVVAMGFTLLFIQAPAALAQNKPPKAQVTSVVSHTDKTADTTNGLGQIHGQIIDNRKEPLTSAAVTIFQNGIMKGGTITDFNGLYSIDHLEPGSYEIKVRYASFRDTVIKSVVVQADKQTIVNVQMARRPYNERQEIIVGAYSKPLIDRPKKKESK